MASIIYSNRRQECFHLSVISTAGRNLRQTGKEGTSPHLVCSLCLVRWCTFALNEVMRNKLILAGTSSPFPMTLLHTCAKKGAIRNVKCKPGYNIIGHGIRTCAFRYERLVPARILAPLSLFLYPCSATHFLFSPLYFNDCNHFKHESETHNEPFQGIGNWVVPANHWRK